ncbi:MAG: IS66 family transposase [Deltaproteobacteria bacterium]|nr:MAG: IS66 family transposase [Deltaproteobacteria bacterium]
MTHDEALAVCHAGPKVVVKTLCDLSDTIESQQVKIRTLEIKIAKLSKNSSNSSKRPSSDDITKPKSNEKKKKGNSKIGGQPGHPRHERPLFAEEEIDKLHPYILTTCPDCNGEVSIMDGKPRILQQIELIEAPLIKEEHRSYPVWCAKCGKIHYMPFPPEVYKEGLFKERLTSLVAYMKNVCHASFSTIRKYIKDVLGEKVSRGYLRKLIEKVSLSLEAPYNELLDHLPLETTVNVDETGHKENGDRFWTWVFKAELYVLFKIDKSRGSKVLIDVLGKEFDGVIGCDYFSAYRKYMKDFNVSIQFCIAHLIRDIRFLTTLKDAETKAYGKKLLDEVKNMFKVIHDRDSMTSQTFTNALEHSRQTIITIALDEVPSRLNKEGKEEKREAQNLANRFRNHGEEYFKFITTPGIDPTNNVAEQAIRFVVIDRHVTQGTRSIKGRKSNERLWTVVATCAIQGRSAYNFILKSVKAYFHNRSSPSLLPGSS